MSNNKAEVKEARLRYERLALAYEKEVRLLDLDVAHFLSKNHFAIETKRAKSVTKKIYADAKTASHSLERVEAILPQFRREARRYNKRFEKICEKTRTIQADLDKDLEEKNRERNKVITSASFLLGLPISCYVAAKNGMLGEFLTPNQVTLIALGGSSIIAFNRGMIEGFLKVGGEICELSNTVKQYPKASKAIALCDAAKQAFLGPRV